MANQKITPVEELYGGYDSDQLANADTIYGHYWQNGRRVLVYGKEDKKEGNVIVIGLEVGSKDLERLLNAVRLVKGYDDYKADQPGTK